MVEIETNIVALMSGMNNLTWLDFMQNVITNVINLKST